MSLSMNDVRHIARLARIAVTNDEVERYTAQLTTILDHFDALAQANVGDVEPTAHPLPLSNVMRADETRPSLSREDALRNAPEEEDGLFRVRAVLE